MPLPVPPAAEPLGHGAAECGTRAPRDVPHRRLVQVLLAAAQRQRSTHRAHQVQLYALLMKMDNTCITIKIVKNIPEKNLLVKVYSTIHSTVFYQKNVIPLITAHLVWGVFLDYK